MQGYFMFPPNNFTHATDIFDLKFASLMSFDENKAQDRRSNLTSLPNCLKLR